MCEVSGNDSEVVSLQPLDRGASVAVAAGG